jgi:MYXO-CTERM domain-containing protein
MNFRVLMALAAGLWGLTAADAATTVFVQSVGDITNSTTASAAGSMFPAISTRYGILNDGNTTFVPSATFTVTSIPEPPAWAMMALGFAGLGYAAFRRSSKRRPVIGSF